jgi:hypothetical protein
MIGRLRLRAFLLFLAVSCATPPPAPAPISRGQVISVLQPNNQSGNPLAVSGAASFRRFPSGADGVGDLLAREARSQLADRGFRVTPAATVNAAAEGHVARTPHAAAEIAVHGRLDGLVLYLEIVQWEPDDPVRTKHVIVGLSASLVDPPSRKVLWEFYRPPEAVATPGGATLNDAYETAARTVVAQLLEGFRP